MMIFLVFCLLHVTIIVSLAQSKHEVGNDVNLPSLMNECLEFKASRYWSYRYCHMDRIEQYYTRQGSTAFVLGKWDESAENAKARMGDSVVLTYWGGDKCSPNGQPRKTLTHLSCSGTCSTKQSEPHIISVSEPQACNYVIHICTPDLCSSLSTPTQTNQGMHLQGDVVLPYRMSKAEKTDYLERVKKIFYHSYNAYMQHAFPMDELKSLSCRGADTDLTPGGMLTLIDALDTLAIIGNKTEFRRVVTLLTNNPPDFFAKDTTISVFETTIRILGGLLSAHMLCIDPELDLAPIGYDNGLLRLARDLGDRLMPAFTTTTKIPYGTVHLLRGVPKGETTEACTAAAGTLSLEFGMLSVITGDPKYGTAARNALKAIYDLRSERNLVGRHINIMNGHWTEAIAGIGSNIDSLYEYYLKQYILFGDDEALEWFEPLYEGAVRHLRIPEGGGRFYHEVDMRSGNIARRYASALQAFWPGLQILVGDVNAAIKSLNGFLAVWETTGFLPEDFDLVKWETVRGGNHGAYLLRPELIESVLYGYQVTKDESWLEAGKTIIESLTSHCLVPSCGYASIKDVNSKKQMDSMPSYFLAETVKYLYLLFDDDNFIHKGNWVFSTEAHPFRVTNVTQNASFVPKYLLSKKNERKRRFSTSASLADIPSLNGDEDICQEFQHAESYYKTTNGLITAQSLRPFDNNAAAANNVPMHEKKVSGYLQDVGMFEIVSTANSFNVHRTDTNDKLIISNLDSGTGMITTNDGQPSIFIPLRRDDSQFFFGSTCRIRVLSNDVCDATAHLFTPSSEAGTVYSGDCTFGDGFGTPAWYEFGSSQEFRSLSLPNALHMCNTEISSEISNNTHSRGLGSFFVHAKRGECSFEEKAQNAYAMGANGLLVSLIDPKDEPFIMAHAWNETEGTRRPAVPAFLIRNEAGELIRKLDARNGNPRVRVETRTDMRVNWENGKVSITAFSGWQAIFGISGENGGVYRLSLRKV